MAFRLTWLIGGAVAVFSIAAAASLPVQQPEERHRLDSSSSSVGPVTESVIGSWQAHGAEDGPIAPLLRASPLDVGGDARGGRNVAAPVGVATVVPDRDWIIDLVVLWRWPGRAPEMTHGGGSGLGRVVHRIVIEGRELRVDHDLRTGTFEVLGGAAQPLNGANVLLLDVTPSGVSIAGLVAVEPRFASSDDPIQMAIAQSSVVGGFVNR